MKRNRRRRQHVSPLFDSKNIEYAKQREIALEKYKTYLDALFEMFDSLPRSFRESYYSSPVSVDELINKAAEAFYSKGWSEQMIVAELEKFKRMHLEASRRKVEST